MTTPFPGPGENSGFPPPPPPPGAYPAAPPPYAGSPPPGYQAYTPHSPADSLPRAGFGTRLGGYLLDSLLYGLLGAAIAIPGIVFFFRAFDGCQTIDNTTFCPPGKPEGTSIALGVVFVLAAVAVVMVLYFRALGTTGQTWGRKIVGIKVVGQMTGEPIGIGKAIGRQLFAGLISGQIFYLGYLWMLWDDNRQTWHDKIVDSVVVEV